MSLFAVPAVVYLPTREARSDLLELRDRERGGPEVLWGMRCLSGSRLPRLRRTEPADGEVLQVMRHAAGRLPCQRCRPWRCRLRPGLPAIHPYRRPTGGRAAARVGPVRRSRALRLAHGRKRCRGGARAPVSVGDTGRGRELLERGVVAGDEDEFARRVRTREEPRRAQLIDERRRGCRELLRVLGRVPRRLPGDRPRAVRTVVRGQAISAPAGRSVVGRCP